MIWDDMVTVLVGALAGWLFGAWHREKRARLRLERAVFDWIFRAPEDWASAERWSRWYYAKPQAFADHAWWLDRCGAKGPDGLSCRHKSGHRHRHMGWGADGIAHQWGNKDPREPPIVHVDEEDDPVGAACKHSAQDWYVVDGLTRCAECDEAAGFGPYVDGEPPHG